jgi:hypothetical protein
MVKDEHTIKPILIHQEIPTGIRVLGQHDSLLTVKTAYGKIPDHVEKPCPHLLFRATSGKQYNIAYFRSILLRDVAYYEIINPNNSLKQAIRFGLQEYFYKYSKPGNSKTQAEFKQHVEEAFKLPQLAKKFAANYEYIFETRQAKPLDYLNTQEGCVSMYLFCRDVLKVNPSTRHYTLDLLIKKISKHV